MRRKNHSEKFINNCFAEALLQLMKTQSFDRITVTDICQRAGIGRATFYRHFPSSSCKEDVLTAYAVTLWEEYTADRKEQLAKTPWIIFMNYIYDCREFYSALAGKALITVLFSIFYKTIGPAEGDSPEESTIKAGMAGSAFGMAYHWIESDFPSTPQEIADKIAEIAKEKIRQHQAVHE